MIRWDRLSNQESSSSKLAAAKSEIKTDRGLCVINYRTVSGDRHRLPCLWLLRAGISLLSPKSTSGSAQGAPVSGQHGHTLRQCLLLALQMSVSNQPCLHHSPIFLLHWSRRSSPLVLSFFLCLFTYSSEPSRPLRIHRHFCKSDFTLFPLRVKSEWREVPPHPSPLDRLMTHSLSSPLKYYPLSPLFPPLSHWYLLGLSAMPIPTTFLVRVSLCIQVDFKFRVIYPSMPQTTDMYCQA